MIIRLAEYDDLLSLDFPDGADIRAADEYLTAAWERRDPMWVVIATDGRAAAICGIAPLWRGVAEAWMVPGVAWAQAGRMAARRMARNFRQEMAARSLHRVSAHTMTQKGESLLAFLGFAREGLALCYGPNREHYSSWALVLAGGV